MKCFDCGKKAIKYNTDGHYIQWYCIDCGLMWSTDKELDVKRFQSPGDANCAHTIGLYRSGRCRACGFKVMSNIRKRARDLGLLKVLKEYGG